MTLLLDRRRSDAAVAVLIGGLAAVVSAAASWVPSFWADEAASLSAAERSPADLVALLGRLDAVHGAYYWVLHAWTSVFGHAELAARLPSALGIGAAAAGTYILGRMLVPRRDAALIAAIAFAVMPRVTWMGLETRSFAFATAVAVWATVAFLRAARSGGWRWLVYGVLVAAGIAFHLYVAVLVVAHALALRWFVPTSRERLHWALAAAGGGLLASPVVLLALGQQDQLTDTSLSPAGIARRVVVNQWFLGETPQGVSAGPWLPAAIALSLLAWVVAVHGAVRLARSTTVAQPAGTTVLLASWLVVPTAAVVAYTLMGGSLYHPRYFGFCAPALALLVAWGLVELRRGARIAAVVVLVVLVVPVYVSQRGPHAKSGYDWSSVADRLEREAAPGDGVYFSPLRPDDAAEVRVSMRAIASAYPESFDRLVDVTVMPGSDQRARLFAGSRQLAASGGVLDGLSTVWVVRPVGLDAAVVDQDARTLADRGFVPTSSWSGPRTVVTRFERR